METKLGKSTTFNLMFLAPLKSVNGKPREFTLSSEYRYHFKAIDNGFMWDTCGANFNFQKWNYLHDYYEKVKATLLSNHWIQS
jgi:hypothetical protein